MFSVVLALWASALSAQTHWTCNINAYQYDMTVYYDLQTNGSAIDDWSNYEVAAFVGDECRGVGETMDAVDGGQTVHYGYLRVRSNVENGETVSFKAFVKNANKEVALVGTVPFVANSAVGMPSSPKVFNISVYNLSFPDNIVGGTVYGAGSYYVGSQATARAVADDYYTFTKWMDGETAITANPYVVTMTKDLLLTPVFTPVEFTISYDLKGGQLAEGVTNPTTYTVQTVDFTLKNPTKEGYDFLGWTGTDLTEPTPLVTIVKGSYDNRSYTAQWAPMGYAISYDLAGGALPGGESNPETYNYESTITLVNPTREGYEFTGWTGTDLTEPTMTVIIPAGSQGERSYTATWKLIEYSISYDLNGGTWGGDNPNPTTYTIETATFYLKNPKYGGHYFKGWTGTGLDAATMMVEVPKGSIGNRTFTATWSDVLVMGDVNGDGIVSAIDVNLCNAYLLNPSSVPDYFDTIAADVDESGSVDAADVTAIINLILKP
jgi:uncharacterized repeat protein (TIGR02543 family)